ncbi:MAG TPA: O-antigen ligase family protein [Pelobium sp.]|nr:O-antigen ligase family protein [Pelobium sp.]
MKELILKLIPYLVILLSFYTILKSKQPAKDYLLFILYFYPIIYSADSVYSAFQFITYFYFLYSLRNNQPLFSNSKFGITLYVLIVVFLGALGSDFVSNSVLGIVKFLPIILFIHVLISECLKDQEFVFRIISALKFTLAISLGFLLLQIVLGLNFSLTVMDNPNITFESIRYPGIFQDPQKHAQFLSALAFIALIKKPGDINYSKYSYYLFGGAVIALFLTGGRAALLGLVLGIFFIVLFSDTKVKFLGAIGIVAVGIAVMSLSEYLIVFSRGESLAESYAVRNAIWQDAYKMYFNHFWLGIGIDNYAKYVEIHAPDQFWLVDGEKVFFDHPESGYLKFLTELGTLGTLGIFAFIFNAIFRGLKTFLVKVKDFNIIFLISALLSWFLGFYSVYSFGDQRIMILIATVTSVLLVYAQRYDHGVLVITE